RAAPRRSTLCRAPRWLAKPGGASTCAAVTGNVTTRVSGGVAERAVVMVRAGVAPAMATSRETGAVRGATAVRGVVALTSAVAPGTAVPDWLSPCPSHGVGVELLCGVKVDGGVGLASELAATLPVPV